jgi:hypothetical protein
MQTVRQEMVSPDTWDSEDLPRLQNHLLAHAKRGKDKFMKELLKAQATGVPTDGFACFRAYRDEFFEAIDKTVWTKKTVGVGA